MKLVIATIIFGLFSVSALAANAPAKAAICAACHGDKGAKPIMDAYPKINGQNKTYLANVLKAYKAGERQGGMSAVMTGQAASLSDAEIEALATYYAAQ